MVIVAPLLKLTVIAVSVGLVTAAVYVIVPPASVMEPVADKETVVASTVSAMDVTAGVESIVTDSKLPPEVLAIG